MPDQNNQLEQLKKRIKLLEQQIESTTSKAADEASIDNTNPVTELYSWNAPNRVFKAQSKSWYMTVGIVSSIGVLFALLTGNFFLIFAIIALVFLVYALNTVPPQTIRNSITNKGVKTSDELYLWNDIAYFWVSDRDTILIINIELVESKGRVILLAGEGDMNRIITEMVKHEDYREPNGLSGILSRITDGKNKKLTEFGRAK